MNQPTYLHPQDAAIVREVDQHSGLTTVRLYDCDGDKLFHFPPEWTDEMIHHAINFANKAYAAGHRSGDFAARLEIRTALGIQA